MRKFILAAAFLCSFPLTLPAPKPESGLVPCWIMNASWYGYPFHGRRMANGRIFDKRDSSLVAHKTLPLGTRLLICHGSLCIYSTVTDRGPYIPGRDLDLSEAAATLLGIKRAGVAKVCVYILG